jgi:hypothetical protein
MMRLPQSQPAGRRELLPRWTVVVVVSPSTTVVFRTRIKATGSYSGRDYAARSRIGCFAVGNTDGVPRIVDLDGEQVAFLSERKGNRLAFAFLPFHRGPHSATRREG